VLISDRDAVFGTHRLYVLGRLEELLLTLALWEDEGAELPDAIAGRAALDALDNVYDAVRPTQSEDEANPVPGRLLAPDGRYEHVPVRFVRIAGEDLSTLEHAAQVLLAGAGETAEAIEQHVQAHGVNRTELVGSVSRLISVLGLAWDEDVRLLWSAVEPHAGRDRRAERRTGAGLPAHRRAHQSPLVLRQPA
jgi:hypothetical protein